MSKIVTNFVGLCSLAAQILRLRILKNVYPNSYICLATQHVKKFCAINPNMLNIGAILNFNC